MKVGEERFEERATFGRLGLEHFSVEGQLILVQSFENLSPVLGDEFGLFATNLVRIHLKSYLLNF